MYNEGAPDFVVDQGMCFPAAANYGYYCTGFESPGEWENHQMIFGVDGSGVQYAGGQIENSPYLCYTPGYGYAQSPYNPYNPYIPGAPIGAEGPLVGSDRYYSVPIYQDAVSSPSFVPLVHPDISLNSLPDPFLEGSAPISGRSDARGSKHKLASATAILPRTNSLSRISERPRSIPGRCKQPRMHESVSSAGVSTTASTRTFQGRAVSVSAQPIDNISAGKLLSRGQLEVIPPVSNSLSDFGSNVYASVHGLRPQIYSGRGVNDIKTSVDAIAEQNRGPRTKRWKNQLVVKAYTTKARAVDAQGDIIINPDQYNKDDFKVDYDDAKFFVIKSYSEDDVHKSIKYNIWSSTPHGNKKLQKAYEDAQKVAKKPNRFPIFLYFSVNASGLFCGVAEMVGPVDFHKDMDFWQQAKWSGSFPVKWHIIKDVPNSYFRHIILENNENKPVTNSRDTQEIMQMQGLEMLKIFKDHKEKTSLLDDFMYYENRQRIMHEEKSRLLYTKAFQSPFLIPKLDSTNKLNFLVKQDSNRDVKTAKDDPKNAATSQEEEIYLDSLVKDTSSFTKEKLTQAGDEAKEDISSALRIGSLTINQSGTECKPVLGSSVHNVNLNEAEFKAVTGASVLNASRNEGKSKQVRGASVLTANQIEAKSKPVTASSAGDIVTVGSMPIQVNGSVDSSSKILTVGTIPLDPRSLKQ